MRKWRQAYFVAQLTYNWQTLFAAVLLFIQSFWLIDVREGGDVRNAPASSDASACFLR
jgi:hypothetical protein